MSEDFNKDVREPTAAFVSRSAVRDQTVRRAATWPCIGLQIQVLSCRRLQDSERKDLE